METMYEMTAPSGVKVYSTVPFQPYTIWDRNMVLFRARSFKLIITNIAKSYRAYFKEVVGR